MKNSIYVLAEQELQVEKLHLCTWDLRNHNTYVEVGVSIANAEVLPKSMTLYLVLPFLSKVCSIRSLHEELHDNDNYKFIFNEIPENVRALGGSKHNGSIVTLSGAGDAKQRTHLIANATVTQQAAKADSETKQIVKVTFDNPEDLRGTVGHLYVRLLIPCSSTTIAEVISGIAKRTYIFDVKINEARNIPDEVLDFQSQHDLRRRPVATAYCLHCVPDNYEISFSDGSKLKNIRKLEKSAFQRYLPELRNIGGEYIITFIKQKDQDSYSFFTTFNREVVGNKQLFVAVVISLLCNLLFAFSAFRKELDAEKSLMEQIPPEWWVALGVILLGLLICLPIKGWFLRLWNKWTGK